METTDGKGLASHSLAARVDQSIGSEGEVPKAVRFAIGKQRRHPEWKAAWIENAGGASQHLKPVQGEAGHLASYSSEHSL